MKGIAHFAVGVAVASCFPDAVSAGAAGSPLYFVLGGLFGLLPDTLDFRFARFFYRHDVEIRPDPLDPDPRMIARALAAAVNRAAATGRAVRVRLHTVRLGADLWQQYRVRFDVPARRIEVHVGPVVDTGRHPVSRGPRGLAHGAAEVQSAVALDYQAETTVDIFDGPVFCLQPTADGRVRPVFIPWHRQWSHGVVAVALAGLLAWVLAGPLAGAVAALALLAHVALDQAGYLGSNLWFPWRRRRTGGLGLLHAQSPVPNFAAVWLSCLLIWWNLAAAHGAATPGNPLALLLLGGAAPVALFAALNRRRELDA